MADSPLRKLRIALGMSQADIADTIGIARPNYSKYENGRIPDPKTVEKILDFFGPPLTADHIVLPHRFPRFMEPGKSP